MKTLIKEKNWILATILLIAALLRLWNLHAIPPSLTPDEAALGYNAYSIINTGRDEHGKLLPLIFQSFGDFKPGFYVYVTIPFVAILGLNEISVRLPSALSGILIVFLAYKIAQKLFPQKKFLPLLVSLVAATNPWLIYFSRGAWEANLSLALTLGALLLLLKGFSNKRYLIISGVLFALTLLTYQGAKLSTLIVGSVFFFSFTKRVKDMVLNNRKIIFISLLAVTLISLPVIMSFLLGQTGRLKVFSVFSYPRPYEYTESFLDKAGESYGSPKHYIYHSEALNFTRGILGRFFNHFSGKYLFFEGDYQNPWQGAPYQGVLLVIDIILLPLGLFILIRSKKIPQSTKKFLLLWLIFSPLPAVLSRDQVQSVRSLNMSIPLIFFVALGLDFIKRSIFNTRNYALGIFIVLLYAGSFVYFTDAYFIHMPIRSAKYWYYGNKEVAKEIALRKADYDRVIVQQSYSQPYIYYLFYTQYDPEKYQKNRKFLSGGQDVGFVTGIENIDFVEFSWPPPIKADEKNLVAGDEVAIPPDYSTNDYNLLKEIKYPDKYKTAFRILENKNK